MKDLTTGSIPRHMAGLAIPMAAGMVLQMLYFFVDLYFVSQLGDAAIAGVGAGGGIMFLSFALNQTLAAGTAAMVAHAVGRKERKGANHAFNQSVAIAAVFALATLAGGYAAVEPYARLFGADEETRQVIRDFLRWLVPGLAIQYAIVVMAAGLRGTGVVKPAMVAQVLSIGLNILLAPVLIAGWGTGHAFGVAGAGMATTLATAFSVLILVAYFVRLEHYVAFDPADWKPEWRTWGKLLNIGIPAGGEFALMAVTSGVLYWAARDFGAVAQAGIGVGFRINQMLFVPVMAVAMAVAPLAGQNFGARNGARVRETLRVALWTGSLLMLAVTVLVQLRAESLAGIFTSEPAVVAATALFLSYLGWNYVPSVIGLICSNLFQALGNTWPGLASTALRVGIFAIGGIWMAHQPWFKLEYLFALSIFSVFLQAAVIYAWARSEMARRLP